MIPKGTTVRQKVPAIEGVVEDAKLNTETGEIDYHVTFTGADGEPSARWFKESELGTLSKGEVK